MSYIIIALLSLLPYIIGRINIGGILIDGVITGVQAGVIEQVVNSDVSGPLSVVEGGCLGVLSIVLMLSAAQDNLGQLA